jgi:hypothetical protein
MPALNQQRIGCRGLDEAHASGIGVAILGSVLALACCSEKKQPEPSAATEEAEPSWKPYCPQGESVESCRARLPAQKDLDAVFSVATRLKVEEVNAEGDIDELLSSSEPADLAAARGALKVDETSGFELAGCLGDLRVTLFKDGDSLAELWQRERHLHWDKWLGDARLDNPKGLSDWLHAKRVGLLSRELTYEERRGSRIRLQTKRWAAAVPAAIQSIWDSRRAFAPIPMDGDEEYHQKMAQSLEEGVPDPTDRALELFEWLGAGAKIRFPGDLGEYEWEAAALLKRIPLETLIATARRPGLTDRQKVGATAYFYHFGNFLDPALEAGAPPDVPEFHFPEANPEKRDHPALKPCEIDWGFGILDVRISPDHNADFAIDGEHVLGELSGYRLRPGVYTVRARFFRRYEKDEGVEGEKRVAVEEGKTVTLTEKDFIGVETRAPATSKKEPGDSR